MKILALLLGVIALGAAASVQAAPFGTFCGNRDSIHERLADKFSEAPVVRALSGAGNLVEMLASPGGTWTMIITRPGGPTCIISTGEMWQPLPTTPVAGPEA